MDARVAAFVEQAVDEPLQFVVIEGDIFLVGSCLEF